MSWILFALALLLVLDALRTRGRIGQLGVIEADAAEPEREDYRVIAAPGVTLEEATRRAACAYAGKHQLDVLDLVPRDLPTIRAMTLAQLVDPALYRRDRLGPGRTAGHALLVSTRLAARARITTTPADEVELFRLAKRLKYFGRADLAIAPAERARPQDLGRRLELLSVSIGPSTPVALGVLPVFLLMIGLGLRLEPTAAIAALVAWHLQPLFGLGGTALRPRDLGLVTLFRAPIELWTLARTVLGRGRADLAGARREAYEELLAGGIERFHEPRRETCPLCESRELAIHLRTTDLVQNKPGTFTLEKCRGCRHVFQNPRLSAAGLDFYYKDFYDGLGEDQVELIFGSGAKSYRARARMVRNIAAPKRWLDVGTGHGHFCVAAREELPDTRFDGLDLGESIDEAERRGWVETGYRGLFPELAPELAGRYDAISMSHYLEHTLDPRLELAAAHTALAENGCLMIEVPDPEFPLARVFGRYWLPWFQPQHLHLLSAASLERLLAEHGFTPIAWHRGEAHQRVDFIFASWLLLDHLAPSSRLPWRRRGALARVWRALVWTAGSPLLIAAIILDNLAGPLIERGRVSNTYRVVATKKRPS